MSFLHETEVSCPYCGESLDVLLDPQDIDQQYIEDCQVCCRPINFLVSGDEENGLSVQVHGENEM
ncbi:CPXCG motif-containing cysteine-rich protein [Leucothrix arctica]|uniref:CPXCG motif-containing cysteine-rich protein n=1 Tax=Leucothrix arctica TaxID=1481894 RepID=A0A317CDV5_9GAMM|nr:CPXCG motif-containing cysteine-rich protein [Leucothrix arctica]PWQ95513.1 CPXCG motif-containing cysteine-rich protein [Leucothrix arctica]